MKNKKQLKKVAGGIQVDVNGNLSVGKQLSFIDNSKYVQSTNAVDKVDIEYKHTDVNVSVGDAISDFFGF